MILIVCAADDDHVAAVEPELRDRGAPVVRFDLAELPAQAELSVSYEPGARARTVLRLREREVDLGTVTAVWSRRPRRPAPDPAITNETVRDYARQETTDAWTGIAALLDCVWLPGTRWQELRAGYKPLQLQIAADLGFEIPPTLITNSAADFLDFYRRHNGAVISKTVHNRLVPVDSHERYDAYATTERVANRHIVDADAVRHCPVTFQPYVDKRVELRITVVGRRVFPVAIDSQWANHSRHDWRQVDAHHVRMTVHDLPPIVERRCVELVERLGLRYGAIDMILTPDGRYVFLEINPNGSWLWLQEGTGLRIGQAISDLLIGGEPSDSLGRVTPDRGHAAAGSQPAVSDGPTAIPLESTPRADMRIPHAATLATLEYLEGLARERTPPHEALAGLRRLAEHHRGIDIDLVWEAESKFGTVHYDALLRTPGGTVSLAVSPNSGLPWALRRAHHAHEGDLLRVNGRTLNMQTVMGYLDGLWYDARLVESLVNGCLVREAVDAHGIAATAAEVLRAMDAFHRRAGRTSADAREAWLRGRGWLQEDLEFEMRQHVVALKLRKHVVGGKIDDHFTRHHAEFDAAAIVRLRVADGESARRIAQAGAGLAEALEALIAAGDTTAKIEFVTVRRRDLDTAAAEAIFAATRDQWLGPFESADGHDLVRVLRTTPAELDAPTRDLVVGVLFEQWLAERRAQASVEWFWGNAHNARNRAGTAPRLQ